MIAEQIQQSYANAKYYQFYTVATILEHVIDCFHTIVSDESNPYHPPLSWLSRKQPQPPEDELFLDLFDECSKKLANDENDKELSAGIRARLERCTKELKKSIVTRTKDGCSPLFMACRYGLVEKASYLLENCGADIEQKGHYEALEDNHVHLVPPIWVAAVSGHLDVVKLLVASGANVNALSDTGSTPLRSVCFMCTEDDGLQRNVFEQGNVFMDFVDDDDDTYTKPVDIYFEIVKHLVENGADVLLHNYNGGTCLINSIHNIELACYLIDNGASLDACDNQCKTALHYAVQQNRLEVFKLLLERGANPRLLANDCDDALQLACLGGHTEIFNYLTQNVDYSTARLIDAHKLLGSSILELHYDLGRVRDLWSKALQLQRSSQITSASRANHQEIRGNETMETCDMQRRLMAYGDINEFTSELELQSLSVDDYRIQSLLISERVLGTNHRETIQRLLYRGTSYINSLRPERCVDFWIYALGLRLKHESIFHFESILAAQAITKLFLDLLNQHKVQFRDVKDVLGLLIGELARGKEHLKQRPVSHLHEEIHDMLVGIVVYLLFVLNYTKPSSSDPEVHNLARATIRQEPHLSDGSSLLHLCVSQAFIEGVGNQCKLAPVSEDGSSIVQLVDLLIENGMDVDSTNCDGLSALQTLCLSGVRVSDKRPLVKRLIKHGAHIDRRPARPDQEEAIRASLGDSCIHLMEHVKLSCLAARKVSEMRFDVTKLNLAECLKNSVSIH